MILKAVMDFWIYVIVIFIIFTGLIDFFLIFPVFCG